MVDQVINEVANLKLNEPNSGAAVKEMPTTLFPKISDKVTAIVRAYNMSTPYNRKSNVIQLVGTVKLHGSHADILISSDNTVKLQSRNQTDLTLQNDVFDFAKLMLPHQAAFPQLKDQYCTRFLQLNPGVKIDKQQPTIPAGEWIGPGIQKGVALSQIPKRCLVIISVSINGKWLPNEPYADIQNEAIGIYNISRGGFYKSSINIMEAKKSVEKLAAPTQAVEDECPFAKNVFGISGQGEGIVWKAAHPLGDDARFWLKTKGPKFSETSAPNVPKKLVETDDVERARRFSEAVVTRRRLEQGIEHLMELKVAQNKQNMGRFMDWVKKDVVVEEKVEIAELQINEDQVKKEIGIIAKEWYLKRLKDIEKLEK